MIVTLAPSAVIATTIALPMPESPPVTRTCFPSKRPCFNISIIAAELLSKLGGRWLLRVGHQNLGGESPTHPQADCVNLIALTRQYQIALPVNANFWGL